MNLSPRITYACAMDACLHASQWRWTILQLTSFPGRSDVITEILVVAAHVQVGNDVVSDQGTNNSNLTGIWKVTFTNERCLWDVDSIDSKWVFFWTCYHYLLGLVSLCITNRDWICVDVLRPIWPGATTKAARTQTQISIKKTNKQTNKQASKQTNNQQGQRQYCHQQQNNNLSMDIKIRINVKIQCRNQQQQQEQEQEQYNQTAHR